MRLARRNVQIQGRQIRACGGIDRLDAPYPLRLKALSSRRHQAAAGPDEQALASELAPVLLRGEFPERSPIVERHARESV